MVNSYAGILTQQNDLSIDQSQFLVRQTRPDCGKHNYATDLLSRLM